MEKSNDSLSEKIEALKKTIVSKEERIVQLELENSELENQARVRESSLEDAKRRLDETLEKLAIEKSEHDELKERHQVETERLRQSLKENEEELRARDAKLSTCPPDKGNPFATKKDAERAKEEANAKETDVKVLSGELGSSSDENEMPSSRRVNSSSYIKGSEDYLCKFMSSASDQPKSLRLVNWLLNDINSRLGVISTHK